MSDRPIIMSGPMVRAILDGRKTQTRRVMTQWEGDCLPPTEYATFFRWSSGDRGLWAELIEPDGTLSAARVAYAPGDRLWAREAWAPVPASAYRISDGVEQTCDPSDPDRAAVYRCGWERCAPSRWRSPIHMPRWASRLTLTVTNVRVQRVQEISDVDALAEGVRLRGMTRYSGEARDKFSCLWDSLNAKRGFGWDVNPWVAAITFAPERRNIDE